MRYTATTDGRSFGVVVSGERVEVDGKQVVALLDSIAGTPLRRLVVGGRARTLALEHVDEGWVVQCGGERWVVRVVDERTERLEKVTGAGGSHRISGVVRAPMPGLVLRLEVAVGQNVEPGFGLVVLEAMKMENEIRSVGSGMVSAIRVVEGQVVEKGAVLIEIGGSLDAA